MPTIADRRATMKRCDPIRWLDDPLPDDTHLPHIATLRRHR